jgi:hypothetical protein
MITSQLLVLIVALFLATLFTWGFRHLPAERWQVMAVVPTEKADDTTWAGRNLTYYGFFSATGALVGVSTIIFLMGSYHMPLRLLLAALLIIVALGVPAAKLMNWIVERKWHGFTIGGASFIGILSAPWIIQAVAQSCHGHVAPVEMASAVMAAMATGYALGESVGRLACISFGCCYGRPLSAFPSWVRRWFSRLHFVFRGRTKKIAYASGLDGQAVLPVQGITAVVFAGSGLAGLYFSLRGFFPAAVAAALVGSQGWRFLSEFLRADYRGGCHLSAYQVFALVSAVYSMLIAVVWLVPASAMPDVRAGLAGLWTPGMILLLEMIWAGIFVYMGRSTVTAAHLTFHVITHNT